MAMTLDIPELTEADVDRALLGSQRNRFIAGDFRSGDDIAAVRRFVGLSQREFAAALGISIRTLQGWEQGRRRPSGAAVALLRIAARRPGVIREGVEAVA